MPPLTAWNRLVEGNARFAAGTPTSTPRPSQRGRPTGPYACVLGCIDGRVPPELVFDTGLGDLMTVRSAGSVLDSAVLGSIEFAVTRAGVRLVVVLGHTDCLAVRKAVEVVHDTEPVHGGLATLIQGIQPSVHDTAYDADRDALVESCIRRQTRRVADQLVERTPALADAVADETDPLLILPAICDVATGVVHPELTLR